MRIKHTHADVYDRESDYYRDLDDVVNAQMEAQKNLSKAATDDEQEQTKINGSLPQEEE